MNEQMKAVTVEKEHSGGHAETTDSASRHMDTGFCPATVDDTVGSYLEKFRSRGKDAVFFPYVYVVDENGVLEGVVGMNALLVSGSGTKLSQLMEKPEVFVHPHTDREHVAMLAMRRSLKAIPVIDHQQKLLGIISEKSILKILHEEHVEDFLISSGIHGHGPYVDVLKARVSKLLRVRFPWLLVGFGGGMVATWIVKLFEATLERQLALAFFIPIMVYMADAVGTQSQTIFIRTQALEVINIRRYVMREATVGFFLGLIIAALNFGFSFVLFRDFRLAFVVGAAMFMTIFIAVFVALLVPSLLLRFHKDPAVGSGPFATVFRDITSIVIYFAIATALL